MCPTTTRPKAASTWPAGPRPSSTSSRTFTDTKHPQQLRTMSRAVDQRLRRWLTVCTVRAVPKAQPFMPMPRASYWLHAGALLSYAAVALFFNWPLPLDLGGSLTGPVGGDTGVYVWNTWLFRHEVLAHGVSTVYTGNSLAHPARRSESSQLHAVHRPAGISPHPVARGDRHVQRDLPRAFDIDGVVDVRARAICGRTDRRSVARGSAVRVFAGADRARHGAFQSGRCGSAADFPAVPAPR